MTLPSITRKAAKAVRNSCPGVDSWSGYLSGNGRSGWSFKVNGQEVSKWHHQQNNAPTGWERTGASSGNAKRVQIRHGDSVEFLGLTFMVSPVGMNSTQAFALCKRTARIKKLENIVHYRSWAARDFRKWATEGSPRRDEFLGYAVSAEAEAEKARQELARLKV